jgi:hypothetical protein
MERQYESVNCKPITKERFDKLYYTAKIKSKKQFRSADDFLNYLLDLIQNEKRN